MKIYENKVVAQKYQMDFFKILFYTSSQTDQFFHSEESVEIRLKDKYIKAFISSSEHSKDYLHQVGDNRTDVWCA